MFDMGAMHYFLIFGTILFLIGMPFAILFWTMFKAKKEDEGTGGESPS